MDNQHISKEVFCSSDDKELVIHHFQTADSPTKVLLIVHGHGEHGTAIYRGVAQFFTQHEIATSVLTLRGHGLSAGKRGHAPSMSQLILDIEYFIRQVRLKYIDASFYLYGHSMGGNVILNYLLHDQSSEIAAGIATSPWLELAFKPPKWKTVLGGLVADVIPTFTEKSDLDTKEISSIKSEVEKYEQDELIHNLISAKLFKEIQKGGKHIVAQIDKLKHAVFLAHGALDKITSYPASEALSEKSDLFEWHSYVSSKHEIHHDVEASDLLNDVLGFIKKH